MERIRSSLSEASYSRSPCCTIWEHFQSRLCYAFFAGFFLAADFFFTAAFFLVCQGGV